MYCYIVNRIDNTRKKIGESMYQNRRLDPKIYDNNSFRYLNIDKFHDRNIHL